MSPEERLEAWLDEAIIGLDLCPFAAKVRRAKGVRIATYTVEEAIDAVHLTLEEARALLEERRDGIRTTLVAITEGLDDFETYLAVVATVEDALGQSGGDGLLQVATFHPRYRFAGSFGPARPADITNRAPYPVLHLLREDDVSEAVDRHPDPGGIPAGEIPRGEFLGRSPMVMKIGPKWK